MLDIEKNQAFKDFVYEAISEQLGITFEEVKEILLTYEETLASNAASEKHTDEDGEVDFEGMMADCVVDGVCMFETT